MRPSESATVTVPGQHSIYSTPVKAIKPPAAVLAADDKALASFAPIASTTSVATTATATTAATTSTATTAAAATTTQQQRVGSQSIIRTSYPYVIRQGRCYLNDPTLPYPLPCDIPELHRQNLRTILLSHVFGAPVCGPWRRNGPPRKVLEVACGAGFWSALADQYFSDQGHANISFTGLDFAPLAPDLAEQGVNWRFVQHDLRSLPLPFADAEFDLIMLKDISLVVPNTGFQNRLMDEYLRVLAPHGILEVWETDHTVRTLLPHLPSAGPGLSEADLDRARSLGIFPLHPATPGALPQNGYLQDLNSWLRQTLERRGLTSTPCTAVGPMLLQEADSLGDQASRRFAILLSEAKWEREGIGGPADPAEPAAPRRLSPDQAALRRTALTTFIQMIESLEYPIQRASGKGQDEWDRWWAGMMEDLMADGSLNGECLEVGAWWGSKLAG